MRFKKIYIEITNKCNLSCPFCVPHKRAFGDLSISDFNKILDQIKPYTDYIYLHVKGEPLLHPHFYDFCKIAYEEGFKVNVTTNGTLLSSNLEAMKFIRQLNISLHATNDLEIINTAKKLKDCYVNFRVWNGKASSLEKSKTIKLLEKEFDVNILSRIKSSNTEINFTLKDNYYFSFQNEWDWPDINYENSTDGYCHALKDHIAILVDGTVVPCCLDNNGDINLGNIFEEKFEGILNSERVKKMQEGFKNRSCMEELCKKCTYKLRF